MIRQFVLSTETQQFLTGVPSSRLNNVIWNADLPTDPLEIPTNPNTVRRLLIFSKGVYSIEATPVLQYNCYLKTLDQATETEITFPRGI